MTPLFAEFHGDPGDPNVLILPALLCVGLVLAALAFLGSKAARHHPSKVGFWVIVTLVAAFCLWCLSLTPGARHGGAAPVVTVAPYSPRAARIAH